MNSRLLPLALMAVVGLTAHAQSATSTTYDVVLSGFANTPDLDQVFGLYVTGRNVFDVLTSPRLISSSRSGLVSGTLVFTGSSDDLNLATDAVSNPVGSDVEIAFANSPRMATDRLDLGPAPTGTASIDNWHFQMSQGTPPMETFFISFTGEESLPPVQYPTLP